MEKEAGETDRQTEETLKVRDEREKLKDLGRERLSTEKRETGKERDAVRADGRRGAQAAPKDGRGQRLRGPWSGGCTPPLRWGVWEAPPALGCPPKSL